MLPHSLTSDGIQRVIFPKHTETVKCFEGCKRWGWTPCQNVMRSGGCVYVRARLTLSDSTSEPLGSLTGTIRLSVLQQQTPETFLIFRLQPNMRYLHPQGKQFTLLLTSKSCHSLSLALSILWCVFSVFVLCFRSPVPQNKPRHTRYMWDVRYHLISGFKIIYLPCLATTVSNDHDQTKILAFSGELFPTGMDYFHGNLFVLSLTMLPLPPPKNCQWYPGITTNLPWILSDLLVSVCSLSSQGNPHTLDFRSMSKRR